MLQNFETTKPSSSIGKVLTCSYCQRNLIFFFFLACVALQISHLLFVKCYLNSLQAGGDMNCEMYIYASEWNMNSTDWNAMIAEHINTFLGLQQTLWGR